MGDSVRDVTPSLGAFGESDLLGFAQECEMVGDVESASAYIQVNKILTNLKVIDGMMTNPLIIISATC